jgi:hypothetical protein
MTFSLLFIDASLVVEISTSRRLYLKHVENEEGNEQLTQIRSKT